jgi:hypothetical protein
MNTITITIIIITITIIITHAAANYRDPTPIKMTTAISDMERAYSNAVIAL